MIERRQRQIEDMAHRMGNKSSASVGVVAHRRHLLDPNLMSDADKKAQFLLQQEEVTASIRQVELANSHIGEEDLTPEDKHAPF